jgi:hypothetical protein
MLTVLQRAGRENQPIYNGKCCSILAEHTSVARMPGLPDRQVYRVRDHRVVGNIKYPLLGGT